MSMTISTEDDDDLEEKPRGVRDDDESDDDEEEDDPDEGKSEADLRAELKRARTALETANKQGNRRRENVKDLRRRVAELEGRTGEDDAEDDDEPDTAEGRKAKRDAESKGLTQRDVDRAVRKAEDKVRRELEQERTHDRITSRAETAIVGQGVSEKTAKLLVGRLDFEDLTLEKDGSVDGLAEAIDDLKADYPELFVKRRRRDRVSGGDERDNDGKGKPMSTSERQARYLTSQS